jgi:hypothetical protein
VVASYPVSVEVSARYDRNVCVRSKHEEQIVHPNQLYGRRGAISATALTERSCGAAQQRTGACSARAASLTPLPSMSATQTGSAWRARRGPRRYRSTCMQWSPGAVTGTRTGRLNTRQAVLGAHPVRQSRLTAAAQHQQRYQHHELHSPRLCCPELPHSHQRAVVSARTGTVLSLTLGRLKLLVSSWSGPLAWGRDYLMIISSRC